MSSKWYRNLIFLVFGLGACHGLSAQESTAEFWPEIDTWFRLDPQWRVSVFVPISKNLETKYREGSFIVQGDYAFGQGTLIHLRLFDENRAASIKPYLIRGGYLRGKSLGDQGEAYNEDMAFLEFHLRRPLQKNFLLTHRLRPELRWIDDTPSPSFRLRYRIMLEKEFRIKDISWVPYVNFEPYFDSRYDMINRYRLIGGGTASWSPKYALEGNFTYQYDSQSSVTHLYALNLILHLFFETNRSKNKMAEGNNLIDKPDAVPMNANQNGKGLVNKSGEADILLQYD